MVFSLVIHSAIFVSSKHLFNSRVSLSWMEVNFFNHNPCTPGVFEFGTFFSAIPNVLSPQGIL